MLTSHLRSFPYRTRHHTYKGQLYSQATRPPLIPQLHPTLSASAPCIMQQLLEPLHVSTSPFPTLACRHFSHNAALYLTSFHCTLIPTIWLLYCVLLPISRIIPLPVPHRSHYGSYPTLYYLHRVDPCLSSSSVPSVSLSVSSLESSSRSIWGISGGGNAVRSRS